MSLYFLIASPLIFVPSLVDGYTGPKFTWVLLATLALLIKGFDRGRPADTIPTPLYPLAALLIYDWVSLLWVANVYTWLQAVALDAIGLTLFWHTTSAADRPEKIERLFVGFVATSLALLLSAWWKFPGGTMKNPGYLAFHLAAAFPMALYLFGPIFQAVFGWRQLLSTLVIVGTVVYFGYAPHRLGFAALISATLMVVWIVWFLELGRLLSFCWLAVLLVWGVLFYVEHRPALEVRAATWRNAGAAIEDSPLLGWGRGQFQIIYPKYAAARGRDPSFDILHVGGGGQQSRSVIDHAHNDFVELNFELGHGGAFILLFFVLTLLFAIERFNAQVVVLLTSFFVGLAYSFFWFILHLPTQAVWFYLLVALLYRAGKREGL